MLIQPKSNKYNKFFKGNKKLRCKGKLVEDKISLLNLGGHGLRSLEHGRLSRRQLNCLQRTLRHYTGRSVKVWLQPYTNVGVSKKPNEVRMGNGKGSVKYWSTYIKPGDMRIQAYGLNENKVLRGLQMGSIKRPIKTNVVKALY